MPLPTKHVLWVDDEAELLEPHRLLLQERGYAVELASNGEDALELLRGRSFDILLLDEQMPGRRGLDVHREVQSIAPTLPVVMVTKGEDDRTLASWREGHRRYFTRACARLGRTFSEDLPVVLERFTLVWAPPPGRGATHDPTREPSV